MDKSIHTAAYAALVGLLREVREAAGVTQVELAARVGLTQSAMSKLEVGERRLDVIQLRTICAALGTTLPAFIARLERRIATGDARGSE